MAAVDFLHQENPPTWAGVEPAILSTESQRQTNYAKKDLERCTTRKVAKLVKLRILFSDEAHFWLNGYVNKQNCRIWSEANPQVYVETPLHPEKLTVWCALWAGGILLQKR
ncbi:hypothetical protein TNCV_4539351 [Trichonephila clavipes]|nr:hypothetical protein TNCV_4539351 [Trichonephila clavipes]